MITFKSPRIEQCDMEAASVALPSFTYSEIYKKWKTDKTTF